MILLLSVWAAAQSNRGGISGTVTDQHGLIVADATVVITNVGTNEGIRLHLSSAGSYSAQNLEPVIYRIEVQARGFKKEVIENVKVDTATTATKNVVLQPGATTETVDVTSDAPLIDTQSGTVGQTVTERQIADIPLNNRSVLDLAITAPTVNGVVGTEDPGVTAGAPVPGFNLSLGGGRPGSSAILADGANNTGIGIAREVVSFTPETVQEFTVQTSAYSAEYGQTGGGVINATTKSGTNDLRGTALWYTRNPSTSARQFTTQLNPPPNNLRSNQGSLTVGGPVVIPKLYNGHDRTFFFFAFEPRWRQDFLTVGSLLPTDAMRNGDFTGLTRTTSGWLPNSVAQQFSLASVGPATIFRQFTLGANGQMTPLTTPVQFATPNVIPQNYLDPTALKALQFMPHAGAYFLDANGNVKNFLVHRFVQQNETRYTAKVDHTLTNSNHMSFRYTLVPAVGTTGFGSDVNGNGGSYSYSQQAVISDTQTFSSSIMNEVRLDYTRGTFSNDFSPRFNIKSGENLATELGLPSLTKGGTPLFQVSTDANGFDAFTNIGSSGSTNNYNVEERYNIADTVYMTRGNMNWKFGIDLDHSLLNVIPFFGASGGRWDFRTAQTSMVFGSTSTANGGNPFASFLLGVPNLVLDRPVLISYHYRWNSAAAFIQNDWKLKPNLTLNLGVRYSLQLPRVEKNNLQGEFLPQLAQSFGLTTPVTLPGSGQVVSSIIVPPFAYAGLGGRSKYLTPIERYNFEPRIGFAWSPFSGGRSLVIRGGYGLSHVPLTGNNRLPNPDFGGTVNISTTTTGSTGAVDPTSAVRLSSNPPLLNPSLTPQTALNIPTNGLVYLGSLGIPGFAVSNNSKIPYVQNWNLSMTWEPFRNTIFQLGYLGSKGTHLFLPQINSNPRDFNLIEAMDTATQLPPGATKTGTPATPDTTIVDPLGRRDLAGNPLSIPLGSLASVYGGFNNLFTYFDSGGSSILHAGYVSMQRRVGTGLTFTANYTYGKSIDNASDAGPDKNVLTSGTTQGGDVTFGAPLSLDRSVSAYDVKNAFSATYIYDVPFGQGHRFLTNAGTLLNTLLGGWTTSGVFRLQSEYPFLPTISDANGLNATLTHTVRPDIVPGVPLINPNYNRNCIASSVCEPYLNPAAFMRPVKGQLGNASRTLDVRGPIQQYFDVSVQKTFSLGGDGKRRLQIRVDAVNVLNHPILQLTSGNSGPDFMGAPNEGTISVAYPSGVATPTSLTNAEYAAWAAFNGQPVSAGTLNSIEAMVDSFRANGGKGALPLDFFHIQLPTGFATTNANAFDIRTLNGYKLWRLRQAYNPNFGQLRDLGLPRYIQFGIKFYF
ncbi:MAG TPA: carboxypeptidase regulatory-like domain-containing protein [Terriglobales bacterium]|nr:carboxypeptidase regulatory-like domain-containing protein [Terriglobales bacterium]